MKRKFAFLWSSFACSIFFAACVMSGCSKDDSHEPDTPDKPNTPELTDPFTTLTHVMHDGKQYITIKYALSDPTMPREIEDLENKLTVSFNTFDGKLSIESLQRNHDLIGSPCDTWQDLQLKGRQITSFKDEQEIYSIRGTAYPYYITALYDGVVEYDAAGRPLTITQILTSQDVNIVDTGYPMDQAPKPQAPKEKKITFTWDHKGRLLKYKNTEAEFIDEITYTYEDSQANPCRMWCPTWIPELPQLLSGMLGYGPTELPTGMTIAYKYGNVSSSMIYVLNPDGSIGKLIVESDGQQDSLYSFHYKVKSDETQQ